MEILIPIGFGNGMMIPATIVAFQNSVPKREIGVASGLSAFTLLLGSAVGVPILGSIQVSTFSSELSNIIHTGTPANTEITLNNPNVVGQILASPHALSQVIASHPSLLQFVPELRQVLSSSIIPLFWVELGVSIVTLCGALLMKNVQMEMVAKGKAPNS